jgi:dCMP deaminase
MKKAIIMYMPVIHQGYVNFFKKVGTGNDVTIFLLGRSLTHDKRAFQKDLRALELKIATDLIGRCTNSLVIILEQKENGSFSHDLSCFDKIIMPKDSVSREVMDKFTDEDKGKIETVDYFLRWDSENAKAHKDVGFDNAVEFEGFMFDTLGLILKESQKSSDLYRQVCGALFSESDGLIRVLAHNSAFPHEFVPFYEGDPRGQFKKGIHIELSTAAHAESAIIAEAAKNGICTNGLSLMVTDFPCPPCAKHVALSGIRKLYYLKGYAVLDGERSLRDVEVEIVKIKAPKS